MVNATEKLKYADTALGALYALRPESDGRDRELVNEAIASVNEFKWRNASGQEVAQKISAPSDTSDAKSPPSETPAVGRVDKSPYYGMGLGEAAVECIRLKDTPLATRDIWSFLSATGLTTAHQDPAHAVRTALVKRSTREGDVFLVGRGKWGLVSWYTDEEKALIKSTLGGMAGRDAENHSENTKKGMRLAKQRGASIGAKRKVDESLARRIVHFRDGGATIKEACAAVGITTTTYNNYREQIIHLQETGEWQDRPYKKPKLRIVSSGDQ